MELCIITTTCPDEKEAEKIATSLVKDRLAACVQLSEIKSIYTWKEQVHQDPEIRLVIKTRGSLYPEVEKQILKLHSYELPQIVMTKISAGLTDYLDWISDNTCK